MSTEQQIEKFFIVPDALDHARFDQALSQLMPEYSRSRLQSWIKSGLVKVNGMVKKNKDKVFAGDEIALAVIIEDIHADDQPQAMSLDIVYEDAALLVINKPVGLVVHPAAGNRDQTLLNGLLHYYPALKKIPRAGIVHRLDKDTSGLMVIAKTLPAHHHLVSQLQDRTVSRQYYAIVQGAMTAGGTVSTQLGRHPHQRKKQAVLPFGGKEAITHYRLVQRFRQHSLIRCQLETGRTHQIRVHMAHVHYPLVGDKLYGGRAKVPKGADAQLINRLQQFPRQALHAFKLGLVHPETDQYHKWEVDIADDMEQLIVNLSLDHKENR